MVSQMVAQLNVQFQKISILLHKRDGISWGWGGGKGLFDQIVTVKKWMQLIIIWNFQKGGGWS